MSWQVHVDRHKRMLQGTKTFLKRILEITQVEEDKEHKDGEGDHHSQGHYQY